MEKTLSSRRDFIANSVKAGVGASMLLSASALVLESCTVTKQSFGTPIFKTGFNQELLPYNYAALADVIDSLTMEIHYSRHASLYATNLQDAAKSEGVDMTRPLEEVLAKVSRYSVKMRNNGGGHYNHELFWKCMTPDATGKPSGKLLTDLEESFDSFESFKTQFTEAGKNRFGSGWAWLLTDKNKKLRISSTPDQENPLMDISDTRGFPLLALDVWEHAYYLRYQNKRADYITNWWKIVNWPYVQERYDAII